MLGVKGHGCQLATLHISSPHNCFVGLRFRDWLGHMTLMCCFLSLFFVVLVILGHCPAGRPIHDPYSYVLAEVLIQYFGMYGSVHWLLNAAKSAYSICKEITPKHNVFTSVPYCRYGVLSVIGKIFLPPNMAR